MLMYKSVSFCPSRFRFNVLVLYLNSLWNCNVSEVFCYTSYVRDNGSMALVQRFPVLLVLFHKQKHPMHDSRLACFFRPL